MDSLWVILFGWHSTLNGIVLLALGITLRNVWITSAGCALAAWLCIYVAMNPMPFRAIGLIALLCNIASAIAVARNNRFIATLLLFPYVATIKYLLHAS
jgi:hypothetical protein